MKPALGMVPRGTCQVVRCHVLLCVGHKTRVPQVPQTQPQRRKKHPGRDKKIKQKTSADAKIKKNKKQTICLQSIFKPAPFESAPCSKVHRVAQSCDFNMNFYNRTTYLFCHFPPKFRCKSLPGMEVSIMFQTLRGQSL